MLDNTKTALVIIDIQERLVAASKYGSEVATNMSKLVSAAGILSVPIVVTEQYPKGLGATVPVITDNLPLGSLVLEKSAFSACLEADFKNRIQELKERGITQIIIGGIETHICVLQTAIDLIKEGFDVHVVKDACASRNKKEYKTGLDLLKQYGAKITCLEIVLFELLRTSRHPNFKEIQTLIK